MDKEIARRRIKNFDIIIKNILGPYHLIIKHRSLYHSGGTYCDNPDVNYAYRFSSNDTLKDHCQRLNPGSNIILLTAAGEIVLSIDNII